MKTKLNVKWIVIGAAAIILCSLLCVMFYNIGKFRTIERVAINLTIPEEEYEEEPHKYGFLKKEVSDYICELSEKNEINPDLVVAILMVENPEFNPDAINRNENSTVDCGLFQLNDKYLWTTFKDNYWFDNVELDPFNWKHNTYIAISHIKYLNNNLKVQDDIILAYNCGIGAVMNNDIPYASKLYLKKVKNNLFLLKGESV